MNSISPTKLSDRLAVAQKHLKMTSGQLAAALRITPEWLSKILNARVQGSDDIGLRLDAFLRSKGIEPNSLQVEPGSELAGEGSRSDYGTVDALVQQIRAHVQDVVEAAKGDSNRLGWIHEQLKEHVAIPKNWRTNAELNRLAYAELDRLRAERERSTQERRPPEQHTAQSA